MEGCCMTILLWLFVFTSSCLAAHDALCSRHEAEALLKFKNSLSTTNRCDPYTFGSNICDRFHPKMNSWKEERANDCCSWDGITCDSVTGHVIGLDLSFSGISGKFPPNSTLFELLHLQNLNLAYNNFSGYEISAKFGQLLSLKHLNLSDANFKGNVPSTISHLSKLMSLDLSRNERLIFESDTMKRIVENLTQVTHLSLKRVNLSCVQPHIFMNLSSSLKSLNLADCDLFGKFPENIFRLPNLQVIDLSWNTFEYIFPMSNWSIPLKFLDLTSSSRKLVELPNSFGNLHLLSHLSLEECELTGFVPSWMGNLTQLTVLNLGSNNFSGHIPSFLATLNQLQSLHLSSNALMGNIPSFLATLNQLQSLDLSHNALMGNIPSFLATLNQLQSLDLSYNSFTCQLPNIFENLTKLEVLGVRNNHLEGPISMPNNSDVLSNLYYLSLSGNMLTGIIPPLVFALSSLTYLDLSKNKLSGNIPELEFKCKSLEWIDLSNNLLQGSIPLSLFRLVNLSYIGFSSNNFTDVINFQMFSSMQYLRELALSHSGLLISTPTPDQNFTMSSQFYTLDLSTCNITEFPEWLSCQKYLTYLDLSNNKINGQIPDWMWNVSTDSLYYLDLSNNSLKGKFKIPWKRLAYLNVKSNLLEGPLPRPIADSFGPWAILDLSQNSFSGTIPSWYWRHVLVLNLEKNNLHGRIPENSFTEECGLNSINFNGNQLEGELPRSIHKCRWLEVIDVGNNHINDTFPSWLDTLPELQVVILRSNHFHGAIKQSNTNHSFPKLKILDVSNNNFVGSLPSKYIQSFKAMMTPDASDVGLQYMTIEGLYEYSVSMITYMKGNEMTLERILTTRRIIDFSRNNFDERIPKVIGKLFLLEGLNLSHNNLSGPIPSSIGKLSNLEWLDLSSNKLIGEIPQQLVDLKYLEVLNLSENKLVGPIPKGKQFDTFDNSSYEGNTGLCGLPLSKSCHTKTITPASEEEEDEDDDDSLFGLGWKIVAIGYGCGTIVGIVIGYLVFWRWKPTWFVMIFGVQRRFHSNAKQSKKKKTQRQSGARN